MIDLVNFLPPWLYDLLRNIIISLLAFIAFRDLKKIKKGQSNLTFSPATKLDITNYH